MVRNALIVALSLGAFGALCLATRSLLVFSRTGPQIREEIRRHYLGYTALSLLRLTAWSALLIAWLAALPMLSVGAWAYSRDLTVSWTEWSLAGIAGIVAISVLQFCSQLLHLPSGIMMSSNYNMTRFHWLWDRLSVSRIRWLRVVLAGLLGYPLAQAFWVAGGGHWVELGTVAAFTLLLYGPLVYAWWPVRAPTRRVQQSGRRDGTPNIVLIGCDTLRVDRLGICGYPRNTTPFLDVFARRGTVFSNCYTPLARTAPSLASLLTGTWPTAHRVRSNYVDAREADLPFPALPHLLKKSGYQTVAIGDWAGSDLKKLSFGFDICDLPEDQWNMRYLIRQGPKDVRLFLSLFTHNRFGKQFLPEIYYLAGIPLTQALGAKTREWISRLAGMERPFFLNVFMATTHPPFGSEYPYYSMYSDPSYRGPSKFAMARLAEPEDIIRSQKEPKEAFDLEQVLDLYDGCVRRFDDEVREIVRHLEVCGLGRNTIIGVYSDHGMEFFEHGTWGQGNSVLGEASSKVPLILTGPGISTRGLDDRIVRTVDLVPTLLELCGLPVPEHVQGTSLTAYLAGGDHDLDLPAFFETGIWLAPPPGMDPDHIRYPELLDLLEIRDKSVGTLALKRDFIALVDSARDRMIRRGRWKLIRLALRSGPAYRLYDIVNDPNSTTDVAERYPQVASALRHELDAWGRETSAPRPSDETIGAAYN
ncbi:MAG: sulfatase [Gammaproteobacteria bacterium]|jgi:arylsulfatase A-like enzyme